MPKPYSELRAEIVRVGLTNAEFAKEIGYSANNFSRLVVNGGWTVGKAYEAIETLKRLGSSVTDEDFPRLFPKGGGK